MSSDSLSKQRFLRLREIIGDRNRGIPALIPVARSTWWAWVARGTAPQPVKLGPRTTAWKATDIMAFMEKAGRK